MREKLLKAGFFESNPDTQLWIAHRDAIRLLRDTYRSLPPTLTAGRSHLMSAELYLRH